MAVNTIASGEYQADYYAWQTQKHNTSGSFTKQMENYAGMQKKEHIVYMKTDDMLFSGGYGSGLSFYIKYAESSTDEDPTIVARGVDENGNEFEQVIHINDINPRSATLVQMHALEAYLGVDKNDGLSSLPKGVGDMGLYDRADFMDMFRQTLRDMRTLGERKLADYYLYCMQEYSDFMADKGKSSVSGISGIAADADERIQQEKKAAEDAKKESGSDAEIITKPDGSRVLLITTHFCGKETVMSIALSQPAPLMGDLKDIKNTEAMQDVKTDEEDTADGNMLKICKSHC